MNLAITNKEFHLICAALQGNVNRTDLREAASLRAKLIAMSPFQPSVPKVGTHFSPLRSSWPTGFVKAGRKSNWSFQKPRQPKVHLHNSTTPEKQQPVIDEMLDGLI